MIIDKLKQSKNYILATLVALFLSGNLQEFYRANPSSTPFSGTMLSGFPAVFMRFGKLQAAYSDASVGWIGLALLIATLFLYRQLDAKVKPSNYRLFNYAITLFFALIVTIGQAFAIDNSWSIYSDTGQGNFLFVIRLIGSTILIYPIVRIIDQLISDKNFINLQRLNWRPSFLKVFMIIFTPKLLLLAIFYPGNLDFNSQYSLMEYYSISANGNDRAAFNSGNPTLTVQLIGRLSDIGRFFGSGSFGIFLYGLIQTIVLCLAFTLIVRQLIKWQSPKWMVYLTLTIFTISPIWLMMSTRIVRDVIYAGIVAIWYYHFINLISKRTLNLKNGLLILTLSLLLILFRSNSAILVLPGILIILFYLFTSYAKKIPKKYLAAIIAVPVVLLTVVTFSSQTFQSRVINRYPNLAIQQIARSFAYHSDQIDPIIAEDLETIVDIEKAPTLYNSNIGDSVFYEMRQSDFKKQFGDQAGNVFWNDYFSLMRTYPYEFTQAFFGLNYLYYYPFQTKTAGEDPYTMFSIVDQPNGVWSYRQGLFNKLEYRYALPLEVRMQVGNAMWLINTMPPISFLSNAGLYGMLTILLFSLAIVKRKLDLTLAGIPVILIFLMNLNAPVNGLIRYVLPLLAILPLYLGFISYRLSNETATVAPINIKLPKRLVNQNNNRTSTTSRKDRYQNER